MDIILGETKEKEIKINTIFELDKEILEECLGNRNQKKKAETIIGKQIVEAIRDLEYGKENKSK